MASVNTEKIISKRTGVGAGIGALVGFMLGGPVGGAVGAVLGGGLAHVAPQSTKGTMTPKRKLLYENALATMKEPEKLRALADEYEKEGLKAQAEMLRKRAALRELPQEIKDKRRDAYRRAMSSDLPDEIDKVAAAFEEAGAIDAAKALHDHASAVRGAHAAGKSAKPLDEKVLSNFADKLAKAVMHYGAASDQAKMAASNFIRARGLAPSAANIADAISIAQAELEVDPTAGGPQAPAGAAPAEGAPPVEEEEAAAAAPVAAAPPAAAVAATPAGEVEDKPTADEPREPEMPQVTLSDDKGDKKAEEAVADQAKATAEVVES